VRLASCLTYGRRSRRRHRWRKLLAVLRRDVQVREARGRVVFNIKANDYRLISLVQYADGVVMIRFFGSNDEYDNIDAENI